MKEIHVTSAVCLSCTFK